jgi:hypothetical protein
MDDFVHEYFSVERFKKSYAGKFSPMTSKDSWTRLDLGYTIKKPKLRRKPGRPRKSRIKAYDEASTKKQRPCSECHELGHTAKHCQRGPTAKEKAISFPRVRRGVSHVFCLSVSSLYHQLVY